uniref:RT_RNaseH domain-containing protein n=1 Tax=Taenia asiatica TaxID=60517 RepID=A0A0R3WD80_TAEAS
MRFSNGTKKAEDTSSHTPIQQKNETKRTTEREQFAFFTMVQHFKHYLIAKQLLVRTDHQALT